jgi:hypothetical protein
MEFIVEDVADIKPATAMATIIYGHSGSGKTTFIGSGGHDVVIIDNGKGVDALKSPYFVGTYGNDAPRRIKIVGDWKNEINEPTIFNSISATVSYLLNDYTEPFTTIAIDDGTMLRMAAMYKGIGDGETIGRSKTRAIYKKEKLDAVILDQGDYGIEMNLMIQFLTWLVQECKRKGKHLILGTHVRRTFGKPMSRNDDAPLVKVGPAFTGKSFPDDVVAMFDNVWFFEKASPTIYRCRTQGDAITVANTTIGGVLAEKESNPNLKNFMQRLQEAKAFVPKK